MKVICAGLNVVDKYGCDRAGLVARVDIVIHTDGHFCGKFEERSGIYRAQDGDVVEYFSYDKPGGGFGGREFTLDMVDGTQRTLIGPWSSRAGVVNKFFPDREPIIECVDMNNCVRAVTLRKLMQLGIRFELTELSGSDTQYKPII